MNFREMSLKDLADLAARVTKELNGRYKHVEQVKANHAKSPNQQRAELIQRAREFVEEKKCGSKNHEYSIGIYGANAEFHHKNNRITCLLRGYENGDVLSTGRSICSQDDVFNADIGKAIALARALEIEIPREFVEAVQPDEKVLGMIVQTKQYTRVIANANTPGIPSRNYCIPGSITAIYGTIINDTNAEYGVAK